MKVSKFRILCGVFRTGRRLVGPIVVGFRTCDFFGVRALPLIESRLTLYVWDECGSSTVYPAQTPD